MAETIVGAKSKLYIKEQIPGITESGDTLQHVTAQEIAGNRVGLDTVIHGVYKTHVPPKLIEVGSVKRLIRITAHGARKGDILKVNNGTAVGEEVSILKVEDADTVIIATEINASIGDEVFIMRHVTPLYDEDGSLNVSTTPGPTQFVQNDVDVEVKEDTVTMANNKPMPGGMYIKKDDGSWYPVTLDTTNPYAHTPIPVAITDVTGTSNVNVDLSGSSLSVNIEHDGVSPSSIKIGDGTRITSVTANNELKTKDADVKTAIDTLNATDFATAANQTNGNQLTQITDGDGVVNTKQLGTALAGTDVGLVTNTIIHGLNSGGGGTYVDVKVNPAGKLLVEADVTASVLPTGAATAANQTTGNASLSTIATNTGNTNTGITELNSNVGDVTDVVAGSDTGNYSILAFIKRGMQNWTTLLGVLPSAKGQQVKADSLSFTLASDQGALPVTQTNKSGTITNAQVVVGTTAVRATVSGSAPNAARKKLIIKSSKNNTGAIYLGSSSVTTANGLEIIGPDRLEFELDASDYYLISDTAAQVVEVLEVV